MYTQQTPGRSRCGQSLSTDQRRRSNQRVENRVRSPSTAAERTSGDRAYGACDAWIELLGVVMQSDDIRIGVAEARTKLEAGEAVALDVVQPGAWNGLEGVIKGSIRIPPDELAERVGEVPRDLDVVAYCT